LLLELKGHIAPITALVFLQYVGKQGKAGKRLSQASLAHGLVNSMGSYLDGVATEQRVAWGHAILPAALL
jgi:hypothetical protein